MFAVADWSLEIKFQGELNETWVITRRDDFSEIAAGVQVADWIGEVNVVEKIENFGAKFKVFCFVKLETLADGNIEIELFWSTQDVASDVAEVCANNHRTRGICDSRAAGIWNDLPAG